MIRIYQSLLMQQEFVLIPEYKIIRDSIHVYIPISNLACLIIDTIYFQRLRNLKQLGTCNYVYPTAVHSRFEHSIGTYHLASRIVKCITDHTGPKQIEKYLSEIQSLQSYYKRQYSGSKNEKKYVLDNYVCELIKIAGLCHDLGHGPFSHVFDDFFLPVIPNTNTNPNKSHETRSGLILEKIISSSEILKKVIQEDEIQFIKDLINPKDCHQGFIYQIISNSFNGLDVDKYDYLTRDAYMLRLDSGFDFSRLVDQIRVIDNKICYPKQTSYEIIKMFQSRYSFHKEIYNHKGVISTQLMLVDIFCYLDKILNISDSINNIDSFCKLTDEYILSAPDVLDNPFTCIPEDLMHNLNNAKKLINRLKSHDIYYFVDSHISLTNISFDKCAFINFIKMNETGNENVDENKLLDNLSFYKAKIGLVSGNKKNPIDSLYIYDTKQLYNSETPKIMRADRDHISLLISNNHQEFLTMIFYKDRNDTNEIALVKKYFDVYIKQMTDHNVS